MPCHCWAIREKYQGTARTICNKRIQNILFSLGNYNELREVIELVVRGKIKPRINKFSLSYINQAIDLLKRGKMLGRAVIIP
jgi:D-arabinose 1-dehydrogenase-like Zn-dependent alcohol dehydrogenase